jgi:cyclophilin family peptidyl-prolyl cis-trans isomerase
MRARRALTSSIAFALTALALASVAAQTAKPAPGAPPSAPSPGAGPVIVVETVKGTFEFETYPEEAPRTVEHVLRLVNRNFFNGLRIHRRVAGFVVQFGDPQTRDMSKRDLWGRGLASGSGKPVGVAEFSKKRLHVRGAVAMAHAGDAKDADSQMYVVIGNGAPGLDGKHTVFGKVISGMDVVTRLDVPDVIKRMSVKK